MLGKRGLESGSCGVKYDTIHMQSMISGQQIRAARALLGLSAAELAKRSGVSHRTLQRFESQEGIPDSRLGNLEAVERALSDLGVSFVGDPISSPGVRLKPGHRRSDLAR